MVDKQNPKSEKAKKKEERRKVCMYVTYLSGRNDDSSKVRFVEFNGVVVLV